MSTFLRGTAAAPLEIDGALANTVSQNYGIRSRFLELLYLHQSQLSAKYLDFFFFFSFITKDCNFDSISFENFYSKSYKELNKVIGIKIINKIQLEYRRPEK